MKKIVSSYISESIMKKVTMAIFLVFLVSGCRFADYNDGNKVELTIATHDDSTDESEIPAESELPSEPEIPNESEVPAENEGNKVELTIATHDDSMDQTEIPAENDGKVELTVATYSDSAILSYAARLFEERHDGVTVAVITYREVNNENTASNYVQKISAEIMSGRGADIINVNGLTWSKFADRGYLNNLSAEIELSPDNYYTNVLDAYLYNGERYVVPLCFTIEEGFMFGETINDNEQPGDLTIERLADIAEKYYEPGTTTLFDDSGFYKDMTYIAFRLFCLDMDDYIDQKNKEVFIDSPEFIKLLETVEQLGEKLDGKLISNEAGADTLLENYIIYTPILTHNGYIDYANMSFLSNDNGAHLITAYDLLLAINANTKKKELALDFLKFLISEEIQSSPSIMFFPVNRKAAEEIAMLSYDEIKDEPYGKDISLNTVKGNIAKINEFTSRHLVCRIQDNFIRETVSLEFSMFFDGGNTALQAAQNIQSKLYFYLNE
ncbi:MAG: extracellular solute-binding protein [Oscillospiraceae bacterium]|nr:extracellular solute-binding protein [Oscillospiraceae bacterium]